ncbi:ferritin-like domain-containing protein [Hymenobacter sp. BT559]|uniref:ferritin-like domain-containing protein n=1 Tax=Hymenobacter sp. BT559 TaxID=2795729 RepID=UPI0018EC9BED|nr:ferritin-like domain-containing protein [Hymenobacter sp. BT559]MBJ6146286.1 hypothetical protein [Hymenobacter sp. BT559]
MTTPGFQYKIEISSRSDLLTLLNEACELEHGLACSYLYAAFSLKQQLEEGGLTWEQLHVVRRWAAQLYLVASQEMFHLAQVWNLQVAIGGTPYYMRPNFPVVSKYYPLGLGIALEPFSRQSIKRFIAYEMPRGMERKGQLGFVNEDSLDYRTVGELYDLIHAGFTALDGPDLFIGKPALQATPALIDFPEIVPVTKLADAHEAISRIVEQGEGGAIDHVDSHYGIFKSILEEYEQLTKSAEPQFQPVRPAVTNPALAPRPGYYHANQAFITNDFTAEVADLFDDLYVLMMRVLQFTFTIDEPRRRDLARYAIGMMPMVVKPLGDALMLLPAGRLFPGRSAGPAFTLGRHVPLPADFGLAIRLIKERSATLKDRLSSLAESSTALDQLQSAARNFTHLHDTL